MTDRDKALSSRTEENKGHKDGGIIASKGRERTREGARGTDGGRKTSALTPACNTCVKFKVKLITVCQ